MLFEMPLAPLLLLGVLHGIVCTSVHNMHVLLRHPHYAEGHQHLQYPTPYPSRKAFLPSQEVTPWQHRPKDYYKTSGHLKSTSASSLRAPETPLPQELQEVREANEHFVRMRNEARCQVPRAQVVCVRDVYPGRSTQLLPRCTLLHRCSEAAGCCEEDYACAPRAMQEVALHFYVLGDHKSSKVEKLLFVNHTECECQPRPETPTTPAVSIATTPSPVIDASSSSSTTTEEEVEEAPHENAVDHFPPPTHQKSPKCRPCPAPFYMRDLGKGACACDCFDRDKPCVRVKRGREALAEPHRRCVLSGQCNVPVCDHGEFDPERGRCPRKPDLPEGGPSKAQPPPRHPLNPKNPNHRWLYFERD